MKRVRQLAGQVLQRSEKSDPLNHKELVDAEQKIEYLKNAITGISKKIPGNGQSNECERRLKKCFEYQLHRLFTEESKSDNFNLFHDVLMKAGEVEYGLAIDYAEQEANMEKYVGAPLKSFVENDFPNVAKLRKNLNKHCLDRDSASTKYHATRKENLRGDMEEADLKVEQSRDALATDMYNVLSKENEISSYILQLLKFQRGYHESALNRLESSIPELEKKIGDSPVRRVFGTPLLEHLRVTGKRIAYPLEICVTILLERGLAEEGLFRMVGGMARVKRLKAALDSGCFVHENVIPEYRDHHVLASTLKMYLRELPDPLLTSSLYDEWIKSMQPNDYNHQLEAVKRIINKLPQGNRDNLAYLLQFLTKLERQPENKMSSSNLAIVFAPALLWNEEDLNMTNCAAVNKLMEFLIKEVDVLFPEDMSQYVRIPDLKWEEEHKTSTETIEIPPPVTTTNSTVNVDTQSPKPNQRVKKKAAAPVPPAISKTDQDIQSERSSINSSTSYYPSGSSTLNRPHKTREGSIKIKKETGCNTDTSYIASHSNRNSLSKEDVAKYEQLNLKNEEARIEKQVPDKFEPPQYENLVNLRSSNNGEVNSTSSSKISNGANAKQQTEGSFKTTAVHIVNQGAKSTVSSTETQAIPARPVAAPRSSINTDLERTPVSRTPSIGSSVSRSTETETVVIRRPEHIAVKPEIPARPASLQKRPSSDNLSDPMKTQCSMYSLAKRQQASLVNISNLDKPPLGHDNQLDEKAKFLGHPRIQPLPRPAIESKFNEINSNNNIVPPKPGLPVKPVLEGTISKSNEKINEDLSLERVNGNNQRVLSHARTRSDGNLVDYGGQTPSPTSTGAFLQTPPSPRSLNKPTQPPPPPPVLATTAPKSGDSTNL